MDRIAVTLPKDKEISRCCSVSFAANEPSPASLKIGAYPDFLCSPYRSYLLGLDNIFVINNPIHTMVAQGNGGGAIDSDNFS